VRPPKAAGLFGAMLFPAAVRHCEERSDETIQCQDAPLDGFAAARNDGVSPRLPFAPLTR